MGPLRWFNPVTQASQASTLPTDLDPAAVFFVIFLIITIFYILLTL